MQRSDARKLALKALAYGTLLSISGTFLVIRGGMAVFGIHNVKEFSEKMHAKISRNQICSENMEKSMDNINDCEVSSYSDSCIQRQKNPHNQK